MRVDRGLGDSRIDHRRRDGAARRAARTRGAGGCVTPSDRRSLAATHARQRRLPKDDHALLVARRRRRAREAVRGEPRRRMRIAFYAPLKPPDHPVPSGDRQIARLLMKALARAGHQTTLASHFRTFDGRGDAERQVRMRTVGKRIAERLVARMTAESTPDVWFTYHVHHKAPDLLGCEVSRALGIPYVIAEASVAPRRRDGPRSAGYADALAAIR